MELYIHAGERCYVDDSLVVYDFMINGERQHVIEPRGKEHKMLPIQFAVVIDSTWYNNPNIIDLIVWHPKHITLSDIASPDNRVFIGALLIPGRLIYTDGIVLYNVCGNQARVNNEYCMSVGSILIFDQLDEEELLELGTLSAIGMFDGIVSQAIKETHGYETP